MTTIPVGYQLHITTWENDADHYKTEILSGLTKPDVCFYLDLARQFRSVHSEPAGLGNSSVSGEILIKVIRDTLTRHPDISPIEQELWNDVESEYAEDQYHELLTDRILGYQSYQGDYGDDGYFCRVFASYQVYYYAQEVPDVSTDLDFQ